MNEFPERNLTDQYISQSFDKLLQYVISESKVFVTDGLGNLVPAFNITVESASVAISASYAPQTIVDTSSFVQNSQTASMSVLSASYAPGVPGPPGPTPDTSSFVTNAMTSSMSVLSASYATTAAFALNGNASDSSLEQLLWIGF